MRRMKPSLGMDAVVVVVVIIAEVVVIIVVDVELDIGEFVVNVVDDIIVTIGNLGPTPVKKRNQKQIVI